MKKFLSSSLGSSAVGVTLFTVTLFTLNAYSDLGSAISAAIAAAVGLGAAGVLKSIF